MNDTDPDATSGEAQAPAAAPAQAAPPHPGPRRRGGGVLAVLVVVAIIAAVAFLFWRTGLPWRGGDETRAELQQLRTQVDAASRSAEQARRETDTLRARLDDAAKVNASLREQLLGFGERARLIEDAVANLADKRLSGHDALLLNEAEMLLALGGERYTLFHDAGATIDAYRAADTALAAIDDAAFSTVRQSISAEIDALAALKGAEPGPALTRLADLRARVDQLPTPARGLAPSEPADAPRWQKLLGQFVRVQRGSGAASAERHAPALARQLFVLDLREAESALLARDEPRYRAALGDAQALLKTDFDPAADAVAGAGAALDQLGKLTLAPPPPAVFGAALKELRNLRATHALQQGPHPDPAAKGGSGAS